MRPAAIRGWITLCLGLASVRETPSLSAQDVGAILSAAEKAYHATHFFRAEFSQTIENAMLGTPERSRGIMFLDPPDRFAMRFSTPPGDRIVADGQWLWLYTPSTVPGQVIREPIPSGGANTPNLFAQFVDRPLDRYTATLLGKDTIDGAVVDVIRLLPRFSDQPFREATIAVARQNALLRRVGLVEESGQRRTLVLSAIQTDFRIPDEEFRFRVPQGVKVFTP
jgi:outer membrane lipoprotein carrier protein